ncbi:MAG TPA: class II fructose-1,6-bisphosphate aldolase [Chloroflexi bacterium]|nr:class II fructose-1,6-bisphosphate aldolase [Chloroflexota bacterium]
MLVSSKGLLLAAQQEGYAVGAFNTNNLEITHAIFRAAVAQRAPVLLQLSSGAITYAGIQFLSQIVRTGASSADVPAALHLDHGPDFDTVMLCLRHGFTSIMRDASKLPFDENVAEIRKVVGAAHAVGVPVEAELGRLVGVEDHVVVSEREQAMTDPDEAAAFVEATGCDFLAVSIGNAHGFYKGEPNLDFDRLQAIRDRVDVPLVLHGASGIPDHQIRTAIELGICKINIDTEIRYAFAQSVRRTLAEQPEQIDPRKILGPAIDGMQAVVERKIELFGSKGRA